jgi:hypothetical protein
MNESFCCCKWAQFHDLVNSLLFRNVNRLPHTCHDVIDAVPNKGQVYLVHPLYNPLTSEVAEGLAICPFSERYICNNL